MIEIFGIPYLKKGQGIHIKKKTPEDIDEMRKSPRFTLPQQWQDTGIDSEDIANMHNTFAFINERPVPGFPIKQVAKIDSKFT